MALPGEYALQGREQRCGACRFVNQFAIRTSALKLETMNGILRSFSFAHTSDVVMPS